MVPAAASRALGCSMTRDVFTDALHSTVRTVSSQGSACHMLLCHPTCRWTTRAGCRPLTCLISWLAWCTWHTTGSRLRTLRRCVP